MALKFSIFTGTLDLTGSSISVPLGVSSGGTGTTTTFTAGSVVFAGTTGAYSQDNTNFFWDATAFRHKVGNGISFPTTGAAITGANYSVGRDATATNKLYFNVPTSASFAWAVNGSSVMTLSNVDGTGLIWVGANGAGVQFYDSAGGISNNNPNIILVGGGKSASIYQNATEFGFGSYGSGCSTYLYAASALRVLISSDGHYRFLQNTSTTTPTTSGTLFSFEPSNNTAINGGVETANLIFAASTQQWGTASITLQRFHQFGAQTIGFIGAATVTDCVNVDIADVVAGTNATVTRGVALRTGNIWINGSQRIRRVASAAGSYTLTLPSTGGATTGEYLVGKTAITGGGDTVTLPSAVTASGYVYVVKDESGGANANNITVTATAGNIDGAASVVINTNYGSLTFYSNGANWFII